MANIVLVEDEAGAAELAREYLEGLPGENRLFVFDSAGGALRWCGENPVNLFILDIGLPDYRGTELGRQIRAMPRYRFTPILFTTELAGEELGAYREIKWCDFLVKPFSKARFLAAVAAALELEERIGAKPAALRIEQKQFVFEYEIGDILFIESYGKRAVIHHMAGGRELEDGISGYSLARLLELTGGALVRCHKSYLVNPEKIARVDKARQLLWLRGRDAPVPIGEKYRDELMGR